METQLNMPDSIEFLLGKISGQLDGFEARLDELKEGMKSVGQRQVSIENRVGKLERMEARRSGILATMASIAGVVGGGLAAFVVKKLS
jgi:hypothetical protein